VELANGAGKDVRVAGAGGHDQGALDADHEIFGAESRDRARQPGLDAERFDCVDPGTEGTGERLPKPADIDAGRQPFEQARLLGPPMSTS
jgi:hypothetical protein